MSEIKLDFCLSNNTISVNGGAYEACMDSIKTFWRIISTCQPIVLRKNVLERRTMGDQPCAGCDAAYTSHLRGSPWKYDLCEVVSERKRLSEEDQ